MSSTVSRPQRRTIAGGNRMRRSFAVPGLAAVVALALPLVSATGSMASPGQQEPGHGGVVSDTATSRDQDNRTGHVDPTARQRALASAGNARARFNALGTPSVVTAPGGGALATGLPDDPVAAARAYVDANR